MPGFGLSGVWASLEGDGVEDVQDKGVSGVSVLFQPLEAAGKVLSWRCNEITLKACVSYQTCLRILRCKRCSGRAAELGFFSAAQRERERVFYLVLTAAAREEQLSSISLCSCLKERMRFLSIKMYLVAGSCQGQAVFDTGAGPELQDLGRGWSTGKHREQFWCRSVSQQCPSAFPE